MQRGVTMGGCHVCGASQACEPDRDRGPQRATSLGLHPIGAVTISARVALARFWLGRARGGWTQRNRPDANDGGSNHQLGSSPCAACPDSVWSRGVLYGKSNQVALLADV